MLSVVVASYDCTSSYVKDNDKCREEREWRKQRLFVVVEGEANAVSVYPTKVEVKV
jgi:hypothetical protein